MTISHNNFQILGGGEILAGGGTSQGAPPPLYETLTNAHELHMHESDIGVERR